MVGGMWGKMVGGRWQVACGAKCFLPTRPSYRFTTTYYLLPTTYPPTTYYLPPTYPPTLLPHLPSYYLPPTPLLATKVFKPLGRKFVPFHHLILLLPLVLEGSYFALQKVLSGLGQLVHQQRTDQKRRSLVLVLTGYQLHL